MGAGIWAGFAGQVTKYVDDNRAYMQRKTERLENLILLQGTKAVASAKGKVTDALSYKDYLIGRGMSLVAVNGIYDEAGFAGLKSTYDKVKGRSDLLPQHIKTFSNTYEDFYEGEESAASDYITDKMNVALGLVSGPTDYQGELGTETEEQSLAASIFGLDNTGYRDVLTSKSPTTGLSGTRTLATIGLYDIPNRGAGNAMDYTALPGKPWPLTQHDDDLELIGTAIDKRLQEDVNRIQTNRLRENSTDEATKDAFAVDAARYDAQQAALPGGQRSPYDTYMKYLTARKAALETLISDVDPMQKTKEYLTMGIEAQRNVLDVFQSFDKQGINSGYRSRILDNTYLPQAVTDFYGSIPVFNTVEEVDAKQAQDPSFKNKWVKVNGIYKYLRPAD
mgnify:CR=1 FL=1